MSDQIPLYLDGYDQWQDSGPRGPLDPPPDESIERVIAYVDAMYNLVGYEILQRCDAVPRAYCVSHGERILDDHDRDDWDDWTIVDPTDPPLCDVCGREIA